MSAQNIFAQIQIKTQAGQGIDLEQERHKLAKMFDQTLKQVKLLASGPAARSSPTL